MKVTISNAFKLKTKHGKEYLTGTFKDESGTIHDFKIWNDCLEKDADIIQREMNNAEFVVIDKYKKDSYKNKEYFVIQKMQMIGTNKKETNYNAESFEEELNLIEDDDIKKFTYAMLNKIVPDYFYKVAASSTGKYHPQISLGRGGLVRHTKMAVKWAIELFRNSTIVDFTPLQKDCIISAIILHDTFKLGTEGSQYTVYEHPNIIADKILEVADKINFDKDITKMISDCTRSHMGEWNMDKGRKNKIMPKPKTEMEKFVHLCDYLSASKNLDCSF